MFSKDPQCTACGSFTLTIIRCKVSCEIPLERDGFSFLDAKVCDTEDEVVQCNLGHTMRLSDLLTIYGE